MNMPLINIVDGCKVRIAAFSCRKIGRVSQKTIDMTPFAGRRVRIWLDNDGTYSTEPKKDHFWQMAEIEVPEIKYARTETEGDEAAPDDTTPAVALPLDLTNVHIDVWPLPA